MQEAQISGEEKTGVKVYRNIAIYFTLCFFLVWSGYWIGYGRGYNDALEFMNKLILSVN